MPLLTRGMYFDLCQHGMHKVRPFVKNTAFWNLRKIPKSKIIQVSHSCHNMPLHSSPFFTTQGAELIKIISDLDHILTKIL